jgi:hypothetical protein
MAPGDEMKKRRDVPGIKDYDAPAGGWGALRTLQFFLGAARQLAVTTRRSSSASLPLISLRKLAISSIWRSWTALFSLSTALQRHCDIRHLIDNSAARSYE